MADGLLSSQQPMPVTSSGGGLLGGMTVEEANRLVNLAYQNNLMRQAEQAGLDYWSNLLTSGQITPAQMEAAINASPEGRATPDNMRQVPFGSQLIGGQVRQTANYPSAPMQTFTPPPAMQGQGGQMSPLAAALQYQSSIPSQLSQVNVYDVPATYQQFATPQRLDWNAVTLPQWLQDAIARDRAKNAPMTPTETTTKTSSTGE